MKKRHFPGVIAMLTASLTLMCAFPSLADPTDSSVSNDIEESAIEKNAIEESSSDENSPVIPPIPGSGYSTVPAVSVSTASGSAVSGPAAECKDSGEVPASSRKRGAYLGEFSTTAYCNCEKCCSGGFVLTYSGTVPKANHTISADISVYPIGTQLMIGDIIYTVEDIGGHVSGNCLDIYFETHKEALDYGRKTVDVYAVD